MNDPARFDSIGGNLALDFVNTIAKRANPDKRTELLASLPDLRCWLTKFGLPSEDLVEGDLEEARAIRERLHDLFRLPAHGCTTDEAALLAFGKDLQEATAERRLQQRDGRIVWGWTPDTGALHRSLFSVLVEAAELLVSDDLERVRECEGPGCGWLFVDRSRGRPRRWCSMRDCGNKAKARRHHRRQSAGN